MILDLGSFLAIFFSYYAVVFFYHWRKFHANSHLYIYIRNEGPFGAPLVQADEGGFLGLLGYFWPFLAHFCLVYSELMKVLCVVTLSLS